MEATRVTKVRNLQQNELNTLHYCLRAILKDVIYVCEKYNLSYTLGGGSVLGAVRHHGFIPWDDDLDINMPRGDYERFKEIFEKELSDLYELRAPNSVYGPSTLFVKLYKKNTTYRQQFSYAENEPDSIWVDIFPFDYAPENNLKRFLKGKMSKCLSYVFESKYIYEHRNKATDSYYKKYYGSKKFIYTIRMLVAKCTPISYHTLYDFFDKFVQQKKRSKILTCASGRKSYLGECVDYRYFLEAEDGIFEGIKVKLPYHYQDYLRALYGDYMQLPPVEKREHHMTTCFQIEDGVQYKVK